MGFCILNTTNYQLLHDFVIVQGIKFSFGTFHLMYYSHVLQNDQDAFLVLEHNLLLFYYEFLQSFVGIQVLIFQRDFIERRKSEEILCIY